MTHVQMLIYLIGIAVWVTALIIPVVIGIAERLWTGKSINSVNWNAEVIDWTGKVYGPITRIIIRIISPIVLVAVIWTITIIIIPRKRSKIIKIVIAR